MKEREKEAIDFYLRNDYLIINAILWNDLKDIDEKIKKIIDCNNAMIKEASECTPEKYWGCNAKEAERILEIFKKRAYSVVGPKEKQEIIERAKQDIKLLLKNMSPLDENLILYRNVHKQYSSGLIENKKVKMLGFSSCSTSLHIPHDKMYGTEDSVTYKIAVAKGFFALRLDKMPDLCNEPDEVILPPIECKIGKTFVQNGRKVIEMTAVKELNRNKNTKNFEK